MADLIEVSEFTPGVFQIETDSVWIGGEGGLANNQGKALANRTKWLKEKLEALGTASALAVDTDGAMAGNSDITIASQKAVKTYVDGIIAAQDAMVFKGIIDCSANPNYPAADRGHTYRVSVSGKLGGAAGVNVEIGDIAICLGDGTAAGNHGTVGAGWGVIQMNIDGALTAADLQKATAITASAGGTADAITAVFAPAVTTDTAGRIPTDTLMIVAAAANTGAALTIDVGTGAFGVVKGAGAALVAGDVAGAGSVILIRGVRGANAAQDKWILLNPEPSVLAIGIGQTYQNLQASRVMGATYTNTTKKPILVSVLASVNVSGAATVLSVNGNQIFGTSCYSVAPQQGSNVSAIVPPGATYSAFSSIGGNGNILVWNELR